MIKSILGFIPIIDGSILIDGRSISTLSPKELSEYIAYVPQAKGIVYDMNVLDVVVMGRARFIKKFSQPSSYDYEKANAILSLLNIEKLANKKYSELSGGEQQIVLIARALIQESKFIVMDEPASNLDFENQKKVLECLMHLSRQGVGIILSSHSPDHALFCNTDVVMIKKNKTIQVGTIDQMLTNQNLYSVYGVDIQMISDQTPDGRVIQSCCLVN